MRFFADRAHDEDPRAVAVDVEEALRTAARLPPGILRHAAVAAALVRAGELAQGLGDEADAGGCGHGPARAALDEAARIARGLWRSLLEGGRVPAPEARALALRGASARIRVRRPEGYAHYGVYPEFYGLAGAALCGDASVTCVGVRSIGTGLAAMVAAGASAPGPIFAVRPGGAPFERRLDPATLREALEAGRGGAFAVVDEGPGLSGSTLAAVAGALLDAGVPRARVHLVTSHAGAPGPAASAAVRELYAALPRHVAAEGGSRAGEWISPSVIARELVGEVRAVAEMGDGGWRSFVPGGGELPSTGWLERRKVLLEGADGRRWVARFAGLGGGGERKRARAEALHAAGLGAAPAGLCHGWLVEPWLGDAAAIGGGAEQRPRLLAALARLLALSARRPTGVGAAPAELAEMARTNAAEALGPEAGEAARRLEGLLPRLAREARPAEVDARLAAWEWRVLPHRRMVKLDGVDHHAGHELSGCQDLLWDVAGAEAELGLAPAEALRLAERARAAAPGADPSALPFYRTCYHALELGRWWYAAQGVPPGEERRRREAVRERYRRGLAAALAALRPGTLWVRSAPPLPPPAGTCHDDAVASEVPAQIEPIERAIQERVARNTLRIPPYPAVAVRVQEALGRKDAGLAEVALLVGADAVLAASILRCANSVLYRRGPPVTDLVQGITRIGAAEVLRLLLASGLSTGAQAVGSLVSMRRLIWIEGLASAAICQELARVRGLRTEEAFVLGLLHDFGKIVTSSALEALLEEGRFEGRFPLEAWAALLDRQHVAVGVATAAAWKLPGLVGEVIAAHHAPADAVRCKDPRLLEVVKLSDQVVGLLLTRSRVTTADLARIDGLSAEERAAVERVVENVPEFVSAFETPAAAAFVNSPRVLQPETTFRVPGRKAKLGISVSVARRPRLFQVSEVSPDGLVATGEEPLPEDRLLEAKVYAQEPFAMWALVRLCGRVPEGFRVELSPFALSGNVKEAWEKMVAGG